MPRTTGSAPPTPESAQALRAHIAMSLRAARARTGLSEQQVVGLLAKQGAEVTEAMIERWESSGEVGVDSAVQLATAYGTTLDLLAGRRSYEPRHPSLELPSLDRGPR